MNDLSDIKNALNRELDFLGKEFNVRKIGIFGSTVRGEHNKGSDIDVVVEFSKPIGFFKFVELEEYLEKILGRKVDLVTKNALKRTIKESVLSQAVYV